MATPAPHSNPATPTLSDVLFPSVYRRLVLAQLLLHPEQQWHVRELARLTATAPGTLNKELARLHAVGLLVRQQSGNQLRYCANTASPVFAELAALLRKTVGVADVLRDGLAPLAQKLTLAFVYGSVGAGSERASSDVDVMLLGDVSFAETVRHLTAASVQLGREVNATPITVKAFAAKLADGDGFALSVLNAPKIWLIGSEDDLAKLAAHRPRKAA